VYSPADKVNRRYRIKFPLQSEEHSGDNKYVRTFWAVDAPSHDIND
jgi:hypothetical protein